MTEITITPAGQSAAPAGCACCAAPAAELNTETKGTAMSTETVTADYAVTGMTCGHCVASVTEEISGLEGVTGVQVDLPTGKVTVTSAAPLEIEAVRAAVDEAGYQLAG